MSYRADGDQVDHLFLEAFDRCDRIEVAFGHDQWVMASITCPHGVWQAESDGLVMGFSQSLARALHGMAAEHPNPTDHPDPTAPTGPA